MRAAAVLVLCLANLSSAAPPAPACDSSITPNWGRYNMMNPSCTTVSECGFLGNCTTGYSLKTTPTFDCIGDGLPFNVSGCEPNVGCRPMDTGDLGPATDVPSYCMKSDLAMCDPGQSAIDCALADSSRACVVSCKKGFACRSSTNPALCKAPASFSGQAGPMTTEELGMVYVCLCQDDCWDPDRNLTAVLGTPPCDSTLTMTQSSTATLPTATATITLTPTPTATLTLPTPTPVNEELASIFSSFNCTPNYIEGVTQRFTTGRTVTCTFTPRDTNENPTPTTSLVGEATLHRGLTSQDVPMARAMFKQKVQGTFTVTFPVLASEGSFTVKATMTSNDWVGVLIEKEYSFQAHLGVPEFVRANCSRIDELDDFREAAAARLGKRQRQEARGTVLDLPLSQLWYVGEPIVCRLRPMVANCDECRLAPVFEASFGEPGDGGHRGGWSFGEVSKYDPGKPLAVEYQVLITTDVLEDRILNISFAAGTLLSAPKMRVRDSLSREGDSVVVAAVLGMVASATWYCNNPGNVRVLPGSDSELITCFIRAKDQSSNTVLPPIDWVPYFPRYIGYGAAYTVELAEQKHMLGTWGREQKVPQTRITLKVKDWGKFTVSAIATYTYSLNATMETITEVEGTYLDRGPTHPPSTQHTKLSFVALGVPSSNSDVKCSLTGILNYWTCLLFPLDAKQLPVPVLPTDLAVTGSTHLFRFTPLEKVLLGPRTVNQPPFSNRTFYLGGWDNFMEQTDPPFLFSFNVTIPNGAVWKSTNGTISAVLSHGLSLPDPYTNGAAAGNVSVVMHGEPSPELLIFVERQAATNKSVKVFTTGDLRLDVVIAGNGSNTDFFVALPKSFTWSASMGIAVQNSTTRYPSVLAEAWAAVTSPVTFTVTMSWGTGSVQSYATVERHAFSNSTVGRTSTSADRIGSFATFTTSCSGFAENSGAVPPISYTVMKVPQGWDGKTLSALTPLAPPTQNASVVIYNSIVGPATYSVICHAKDKLGAELAASNHVAITVEQPVPPASQDDRIRGITASLTPRDRVQMGQVQQAAEELRILDKAKPAALMSAVNDVGGTLLSVLGRQTVPAPILVTTLSTLANITVQSASSALSTDRAAAHFILSKCLGQLPLESMSSTFADEVLRTVDILLQTTSSATAARFHTLDLSHADGIQMASSILRSLCNVGAGQAARLPVGSCWEGKSKGVHIKSCAREVQRFNEQLEVNGARMWLSPRGVDTALIAIVTFAVFNRSPYGFDYSARASIGPTVSICAHSRDSLQPLDLSTSSITLTAPASLPPIEGYTLADYNPSVAMYKGDRLDSSSCSPAAEPVSASPTSGNAVTVSCSGLKASDPTPLMAVSLTSLNRCDPSDIPGCASVNNAATAADCRCIQCGNSYLSVPVSSGLACQVHRQLRCSDTEENVRNESQCIGGSRLVQGRCVCLDTHVCFGLPATCVLKQKCGAIATEIECIAAGLVHRGSDQLCVCPTTDEVELYCDNGVCRKTLKCNERASSSEACGTRRNTVYDTSSSVCGCSSKTYCHKSGSCVPRAGCDEYPEAKNASYCAAGLDFSGSEMGEEAGGATKVQLSTAVTPAAVSKDIGISSENFAAGLAAKLAKANISLGGEKYEVLEAVGKPVLSQSETFAGITAKIDVTLALPFSLVNTTSRPLIHAAVLNAMGAAEGTRPCHGTAVQCVFTSPSLPIFASAVRLRDGVCKCPLQQECNAKDRSCRCPKCHNRGKCEYPSLGRDNHNCTCEEGWAGADCSVLESPTHHFLHCVYPAASYSQYEKLAESEQQMIAAKAKEVVDSKFTLPKGSIVQAVYVHGQTSLKSLTSRFAVQQGSGMTISYDLLVLQSTWRARASPVLNTSSTAAVLGVELGKLNITGLPQSAFQSSQVAAALASTAACDAIENCAAAPVPWYRTSLNQKCKCLLCNPGMLPDPDTNSTSCFDSTPCDAADCNMNGIPSGYKMKGCSCDCAEVFSGKHCEVDTCLENTTVWLTEKCGWARCSRRFDHRTRPSDVVGGCYQPDDSEFEGGHIAAIVVCLCLAICVAGLVVFYVKFRRMPWESEFAFAADPEDVKLEDDEPEEMDDVEPDERRRFQSIDTMGTDEPEQN